jgi:hypothetical protein
MPAGREPGRRDRCVAHPSRPAADSCPRCGRARCAADGLAQDGRGCTLCRAQPPPPLSGGRIGGALGSTRAGLAASAVALAGAAVGYNYVQTQLFSLIVPGLVGLLCGRAAIRCARRASWRVQLVAVGCAAASALLAFRFAAVPFGPPGRWLPPMLLAAVLAWLASRPSRTSPGRKAHPDG